MREHRAGDRDNFDSVTVLTRCPLTEFQPVCGPFRTYIVNFWSKDLVVIFMGGGVLECL